VDNNVILPFFTVGFKGKVSIYSAKITTILLPSSLIINSSLSSLSSNIF
jgi:hypothetical protein